MEQRTHTPTRPPSLTTRGPFHASDANRIDAVLQMQCSPSSVPGPGDPGYDHTKASWYTKPGSEMTDDEVNEARAYYDSIGSRQMEGEWLRRHGLPEDYGDPAVSQ